MGILNSHTRKEIRYKNGDLVVYEPTDIQREELEKLLEEKITVDENLNAKGELDIKVFRYLIKEFTSIKAEVDEYSDKELNEKFLNADRDLLEMKDELEKIVNETVKDIQKKQYQIIDSMERIVAALEFNQKEEIVMKKFNKIFKSKGLDLTVEELAAIKSNPSLIAEKIKDRKTVNKKKKK